MVLLLELLQPWARRFAPPQNASCFPVESKGEEPLILDACQENTPARDRR